MEVKKVKVKMLVDTAYQGPRKVGDVIMVPEDFANRWAKNKIAEIVGESKQVAAAKTEQVDYESMSAKDLYALCKERGIEVEAKKSKEYYLEKLA